MSSKRIGYLVLFIALVVLGIVIYPQYQQRQEEARAQKQAEEYAAEAKREVANAAKLPHEDFSLAYGVPKTYPRPRSAWRVAEKAFYESLLSKGRFDVLVVPFQVQDYAFARDIRSLMTAQLAMAIAEASGAAVADPYLVARALGDGERRLELGEIFRLANALGAKRIVVGYVGHEHTRRDPKGTLRLTLHSYERSERETFSDDVFAPRPGKFLKHPIASDRLKSRHFENLAYLESTPIDAYQAALPTVLGFLGMDAGKLQAAKAVSRFEAADLPRSPLAFAGEAAEPARDAYFLQLMATLAPRWAERERERLIEKSMLAVLRMSPESPDYRVLKARALMNMGLRPAALRALGTPASAEEKHLFALLNGNLPEVQAQQAQIPRGVRALIATLELNTIVSAYGLNQEKRRLAEVKALKLPGDTWAYLARRAASDSDGWAQFENLEVKALLDRELPVDGFTADAMLRGAAAAADMGRLQNAMDLSVLEHVRKYLQGSAARLCCQPLAARPGQLDFLDLAEGIATENLSRRATFFGSTQGRPAAALQFLAKIENTYKDHPVFALTRAETEVQMAKAASGAEKEGLLRSAYAGGINVWYWEQGQTRGSSSAYRYVLSHTGRRQDFGNFPDLYANDYPFRPFYLESNSPDVFARQALENSSIDFRPATYLEWQLGQNSNKWQEVDELMSSLEGRFNGNPDRIRLMAQSSARKGDIPAAERYYAEGIRAQPTAERLYTEFGKLLFENGAQERAARVFMSFPGLKNPAGMNPVGLANYAYVAGSLYYWSGDFTRALPLYTVAAKLRTGSDSSQASEIRLALLNGDYVGALRGSLGRARQYNSSYAYRDYFGLVHAMGYSKEAWEGFTDLVRQTNEPHIWETALVGHRMQGASEAEVAKWLAQEPMRSARGGNPYEPNYASMYMLRFGVTDRMPSPELPALIAGLEPEEKGKTKGKSSLVYYAEAYASIRSGKFEAARAMFEEASAAHVMEDYLLPAYAYAAARSNNLTAVEKRLDGMPSYSQRFDYYLARAIIAAVGGKRDESMQHLKLALVRRPFTEGRPIFTEYQYAEVCEWLFEATRDTRYRNLALDWAKKNQAFQPWFAWAYAMEARLSTNPAERGRAIAIAYYLDRKSARLGLLPKGEVANAVKEYANRNPFRRATHAVQKQPA